MAADNYSCKQAIICWKGRVSFEPPVFFNSLKHNNMNREQVEKLKMDVKYLGFGDTNTVLYSELETKVTEGHIGFDLYTEGFFDDDTRMEAKLYFELTK